MFNCEFVILEIIDIRSHGALPAMCKPSSPCTLLSYEVIALEVMKLGR
jgi:hypothetical protein